MSVILPLRLDWEPCYRTDAELFPGARIRVPFAHGDYVGVVHRTGVEPEVDISRIQAVTDTDTGLSPVSAEELRFWEFLSDYYLCTIGEVYKLASPLIRLRSEQRAVNAAIRSDERERTAREHMRERLRSRVEKLSERLERKKAELERREQLERNGHKRISRDVSESLRAEIISAEAKLSAARRSLAMISEETDNEPVSEPQPVIAKPAAGRTRLITGPGRFERYVKEARGILAQGLDVLLLVPEIAESELLVKRLAIEFPTEILSCTSKETPARRRKAAEALRSGSGPHLVIGTRAGLFLPFSRLGMVIVENEQDTSYKQTEPAPRYNARDAALMLARIHGAQSLLGAASPSLESLFNSLAGKYERLEEDPFPQAEMIIIDVNDERRKNGMRGSVSVKLIERVRTAKGSVAFIRGWEKLAELQNEIRQLFPDTETAILTYNEAKHTDLSQFALVALVQADFLLGRNDFRCDERALQTLSLLREQTCGNLVVQTAKSSHQLYSLQDAGALLAERKAFGLPPFSRLVDVIFTDKNTSRLEAMSSRLKKELQPLMEMPERESLTLRYAFQSSATLSCGKQSLKELVRNLEKDEKYTGHIIIDVDPI